MNSGEGIGAAREVSGIPNGFGRAVCHPRFVVLSLTCHGTQKKVSRNRAKGGGRPESDGGQEGKLPPRRRRVRGLRCEEAVKARVAVERISRERCWLGQPTNSEWLQACLTAQD